MVENILSQKQATRERITGNMETLTVLGGIIGFFILRQLYFWLRPNIRRTINKTRSKIRRIFLNGISRIEREVLTPIKDKKPGRFFTNSNTGAVDQIEFYSGNNHTPKGIDAFGDYSLVKNIDEVSEYAECPYGDGNIRETFHQTEIVKCSDCGAFHHKDCFNDMGRCGSFYCIGR